MAESLAEEICELHSKGIESPIAMHQTMVARWVERCGDPWEEAQNTIFLARHEDMWVFRMEVHDMWAEVAIQGDQVLMQDFDGCFDEAVARLGVVGVAPTCHFVEDRLPDAIARFDPRSAAAQVFDFVGLLLPVDIANEQLGDALEVIERMRGAGAPSWRIHLVTVSAVFWAFRAAWSR